MIEIIGSLIEGVILSLPSKKNRSINQKFKMLKKENWYQESIKRYGTLIQMNPRVRNFVSQNDIEKVLRNTDKIKKFRIEFESLLKEEKL